MSGKTKKSLSPTITKLTTWVPIFTIVLVLGLTLYSYNATSQICGGVISSTKKTIAAKQYKDAYNYLKSKATNCQAGQKPSLDEAQYQRYLSVSAYETGNHKVAQEAAYAALDNYKKMADSDKERMGDSSVFIDTMADISYHKGIKP